MGNSQVAISVEQWEQAAMEATSILKGAGVDPNADLTLEEWKKVFGFLDANDDKVVSRKEWCLQQETTEMFDAIHKRNTANCSEAEWLQAFIDLDINGDGKISINDWRSRKTVSLAMMPLGYGRYHWGVRIDKAVIELPIPGQGQEGKEIAVLGPDGIIALGGDLANDGKKQGWMELMLKYTQEGARAQSSWLESKSEPASLPADSWTEFQIAGWTSKTSEDILSFIKGWVAEHPTYIGFHALGKEVNNQTFCKDLISYLTGAPFSKWTDGSKGRALAVGGALVLGIAAVAVYRNSQPAEEGTAVEDKKAAAAPAVEDKQ